MGGKVIKVNLFAIICTILLIIAVIVGIVVFIATKDDGGKSSGGSGTNDNNSLKPNVVQDDKDSYKELDKKEFVIINGETKEIAMKTYEKRSEYRIDYDIEKFYINENAPDDGIFIESQVSDTILIKISKKNDFKSKSNEIITNEAKKKKEDSTYMLKTRDFNGHLCYIESKETDTDIVRTYFMENKDEYYEINVKCGKTYSDSIMPIIEKMIDSFIIM